MTAADVFETAVVLTALLYGLRLRYDDKAAERRHAATQANANRKHVLAARASAEAKAKAATS